MATIVLGTRALRQSPTSALLQLSALSLLTLAACAGARNGDATEVHAASPLLDESARVAPVDPASLPAEGGEGIAESEVATARNQESKDPRDLGNLDGTQCERKCDNGITASFSCTRLIGSSLNYDSRGVFRMRLVSESGSVLQDIPIQRKSRRISHVSPYPDGYDIVVSNAARRIVFRVGESFLSSGGEMWWIFDEDTGGLLCVDLPLNVWSDHDRLGTMASGVFALSQAPFVVASFLSPKGCRELTELRLADRIAVFDLTCRAHPIWTSSTDGPDSLSCGELTVGADGNSFEWNGLNGSHRAWHVSSFGDVTPIESK